MYYCPFYSFLKVHLSLAKAVNFIEVWMAKPKRVIEFGIVFDCIPFDVTKNNIILAIICPSHEGPFSLYEIRPIITRRNHFCGGS